MTSISIPKFDFYFYLQNLKLFNWNFNLKTLTFIFPFNIFGNKIPYAVDLTWHAVPEDDIDFFLS